MPILRSLLLACTVFLASCTTTYERPPFNSPLTTLELMEWVLDPAADGVWGAVGWISNSEGDKEFYPKTQEEWDVVRNSAATLPHNLAAGWIGGLLPLIVTWLNQKWGNEIAGLWYPTIFLASAAILALLYLPETKKIDLSI